MGGPTGVKRVKSGCVTCRIRRVKCGEERPECHRCTSTGRRCDGYSTLPFSRRDLQAASQLVSRQTSPLQSYGHDGLLPRLVTDPAFSDMLEKRYFQFFRLRTVASTNSTVNSRFWDRVVLQACHSEPAVKHAVLALSSLHQMSSLPPHSELSRQHEHYAEQQHQRALEEARNLIASATGDDIDRVLVTCIVFIAFESVRGGYLAASTHMDSGRAIVMQHARRLKNNGRRKDLMEIEHALARFDLPAMTFSDQSSPYRYTLEDFYPTNPKLDLADHFNSVQEAQAAFVDLLRWLLLIISRIEEEEAKDVPLQMAHYLAEKDRCSAVINRWNLLFEEAFCKAELSDSIPIVNLRLWHACAIILSDVRTYGTEKRYDHHIPVWRRVVDWGEQMAEALQDPNDSKSFSFDLGWTIPVYLAATRCRDPILRRRAIRILHEHPRQEGVWESGVAAAVAARWVAVEEEGLGTITCAADIPEYRRIVFIDVSVDLAGGTAQVTLTPRCPEPAHNVIARWGPEYSDAAELLCQVV